MISFLSGPTAPPPYTIRTEAKGRYNKYDELDRREKELYDAWYRRAAGGENPIRFTREMGAVDLKVVSKPPDKPPRVWQFRLSKARRVLFREDPNNVTTVTDIGNHLP